MDNLSANKTPPIRAWAARNKVELCLTPTNASWANPIEAQFGPLRTFTMGASNHPNHTVAGPHGCRTTCAGATPTPATPTSSPPNAANEPGSAANANNAGADHDPSRLTDPVNVHGQRTSAVRGSPGRRSVGGARGFPRSGTIRTHSLHEHLRDLNTRAPHRPLHHRLDPGLQAMAHQGAKRYRETYELVFRREAEAPNEIWQADRTQLAPDGLAGM